MKIGPVDKSRLANPDQELLQLAAGNADWFVRTADDGSSFAKPATIHSRDSLSLIS